MNKVIGGMLYLCPRDFLSVKDKLRNLSFLDGSSIIITRFDIKIKFYFSISGIAINQYCFYTFRSVMRIGTLQQSLILSTKRIVNITSVIDQCDHRNVPTLNVADAV